MYIVEEINQKTKKPENQLTLTSPTSLTMQYAVYSILV